jgi:hypothetical protein
VGVQADAVAFAVLEVGEMSVEGPMAAGGYQPPPPPPPPPPPEEPPPPLPDFEPGACDDEEMALFSDLPSWDENAPNLAASNPGPEYHAGW